MIKTLRTDRGGEYCSKQFQEFLKDQGIHHQMTTSYTPQQNGIAERKNRTLMELARSMIKTKQMDNTYWAEAVSCASYIINRTTSKYSTTQTPQEMWSGTNPKLIILKYLDA
jgi:transposase InsO family protein